MCKGEAGQEILKKVPRLGREEKKVKLDPLRKRLLHVATYGFCGSITRDSQKWFFLPALQLKKDSVL